jgi:hypothetical protein
MQKKNFIKIGVWGYLPVCCLVLLGGSASAGEPVTPHSGSSNYFYHVLPYGSDAAFNPASELINGAFGIMQISSRWMTLDQINWSRGLDVTWQSITHPGRTIDAYGRKQFVTNELVPGSFRWSGLQYVPNYHLHLIGGGARNRAFAEWYDMKGFALPGVWALATTIVHSFAVEAVEHQNRTGPTVDPVADMLLFDPAGALLFSFDRVSRFFSHTLNMSIWSGQPMYNPVLNSMENAGQNYAFHFFFGKDHPVGIFQYWGMSDLLGITLRTGSELDWSFGFGGAVAELKEEERGEGMTALYARVAWDAGGFLHRNGSLLASLHVSEAWTQRLRLNVYPGVFRWGRLSPGLYLGVRETDVIFGLSFISIPLGVAVSQ